MTPDERHDEIVQRFPGGLTPEQFKKLTLESADEDGKLDPPSLSDWFAAQGLLVGMWMDDLIMRRCLRHETGPWYITDKGRSLLNQAKIHDNP